MKTLYLMRHAYALPGYGMADIARPLDVGGIAEAAKAGRYILSTHFRPDMIITSPAVRAWGTAKIVAEALAYPVANILPDKSIYNSEEENLLDIINQLGDELNIVLMVGHNPGISVLAQALCKDINKDFAPAGLACIKFESTWGSIKPFSGELVFFLERQ